jgi:uncharacterized protein
MANWDKIQSEGNVEDRRGNQVVGGVASIGTIALIGVLMFANGASGSDIKNFVFDQLGNQQTATSQGQFSDPKHYEKFASKIIGSNNEVWKTELAKQGIKYQEPKLVLFRGATESGCGGADSRVGPHYCQVDRTVYLDETFFEELTTKFGAKGGEVAEAYVMAHEVGHHIQKLKGTFAIVDTRDNESSVKVELQADCYAGLWLGNVTAEGVVTEDEIGQALDAAAAVGDDRIQKSQGGSVNPESWTHGSSAQRKQWFLTGYKTKDSTKCDTVK